MSAHNTAGACSKCSLSSIVTTSCSHTRKLLPVHAFQFVSHFIVGPLLLLTELGPLTAQQTSDVCHGGSGAGFAQGISVDMRPHNESIWRPFNVSIPVLERLQLLQIWRTHLGTDSFTCSCWKHSELSDTSYVKTRYWSLNWITIGLVICRQQKHIMIEHP